ncbi:MAG: hypothetical protein FJ006_02960 [Chloroflexi bacterium]|nr:hypothetical protein [Chloroflexota bacterium]
MVVFPSKEWVEAVLEAAKQNENKEAAKGWHGDFLCTVEGDEELSRELNRKEVVAGLTSLMGILPPKTREKYKNTPTGRILESLGIPLDASIKELNIDEVLNKASKLSTNEMRDIRMHIWADFRDGVLRDLMPVAPGEHEDAIFKLSGNYSTWKMIASGKQDVIKSRITGKLKLEVALKREVALSYVMLRMKPVVTSVTEVFTEVPVC